ncbi:TraM recognition domain-containing protein [Chitinophaga agrisoli]|uniref:TraM recognition domain-containing protein n=1 Tax=Chitinophaga agrisoli TaxID=2607653 RepID=A0A5B2VSC0_9BACT|nr:TraM recognition domain-containing protein [Chitinophaga agrisoli]KAA2241530.1 TraM recognition domain-containing protein [Chitinophaga agrisoli]
MTTTPSFDLDTVLFEFADKHGRSEWTIRQAVEQVCVFGACGAGKTSSVGRALALKYLSHGFSGLVLCAKAEEKALWQEYCRQTNRLDDLIVIEPGGKHRFNFLEYESSQRVGGISITQNIVQVLKTVIASDAKNGAHKNDDVFWENAQDMLLTNVISLCNLAYGKVFLRNLFDVISTAPKREQTTNDTGKPTSFEQAFTAAQKNVYAQIERFEKGLSPAERDRLKDEAAFESAVLDALPDAALMKQVDQFFAETFRNLSEKTRSIIEFSFSGFLFRLLQEPVYSLFCKGTSTVTPEDCLNGKIILLNLPVKHYHKAGRDCQVLFKYIWQRAMERRNVAENNRVLFLYADEAQLFLHPYDAEYQATARSSRIITTYLSQNLPNYHANMGGDQSEYRVKSLLGTFGTKFFLANADTHTNKYASELIGSAYTEDHTHSVSMSGKFSSSRSKSYKLEQMVRPEEFAGLKTGGPLNNFEVECYMHCQGKPFASGLNFNKVKFKQI